MKHILLMHSFNYKKRHSIALPDRVIYDRILGAWVVFPDKSLLINNSIFPMLGSKKEDIETGEDQKGH